MWKEQLSLVFYGSDTNGNIKTFSRGGSDITGAIIARAANASVYENWTDVNGFMIATHESLKILLTLQNCLIVN